MIRSTNSIGGLCQSNAIFGSRGVGARWQLNVISRLCTIVNPATADDCRPDFDFYIMPCVCIPMVRDR